MRKTKVHVVEVVPDADLRKKEAKARAVVKRFFPNAGPVRLYRTAEGRVGCQLDLTVTAGDRSGWTRPTRRSWMPWAKGEADPAASRRSRRS